nr:uncharacterized protein LOC126516248 isoform X3 [Dermacentor andersoni]
MRLSLGGPAEVSERGSAEVSVASWRLDVIIFVQLCFFGNGNVSLFRIIGGSYVLYILLDVYLLMASCCKTAERLRGILLLQVFVERTNDQDVLVHVEDEIRAQEVIVKKKAEDKFVVKVMDLTKATAASHKTALGHKEHSVQTNADRTTPGKRTVRIDNYDGARAIVDTYKTVGHTQRTKMTNGENMRARFHLKEIHQLCWLGHHHATGTLVTVVATGLTEELSRRLASFVIRHL